MCGECLDCQNEGVCYMSSLQFETFILLISLTQKQINKAHITSFKMPLFSFETFKIKSAIKPVQPVW